MQILRKRDFEFGAGTQPLSSSENKPETNWSDSSIDLWSKREGISGHLPPPALVGGDMTGAEENPKRGWGCWDKSDAGKRKPLA